MTLPSVYLQIFTFYRIDGIHYIFVAQNLDTLTASLVAAI